MEERKRRFQDREDVSRRFVTACNGASPLACSAVRTSLPPAAYFRPPFGQLRLVVLPPDAAFSRSGQSLAIDRANEILKNRGDQPRFKQNRLIFLAADYDSVSRLKDQVRSTLAWQLYRKRHQGDEAQPRPVPVEAGQQES